MVSTSLALKRMELREVRRALDRAGRRTRRDLTISIVMPCLNEASTVGSCVVKARAWMQAMALSGEVIVVDNGSTDGSVDVARAAGARVVVEAARGYGKAYLRGFAEAHGKYIVMGDSDGTYDFSDLDALFQKLVSGYDLVLGNRLGEGLEKGAMPWLHRYVGTPAINALIRLFIGVRLGDSQSGLRAFRRESLRDLRLRSGGMELASEMIVRAARSGMQITDVPIRYSARQVPSKLNTLRDGWRHLRFLLLAAPDHLFVLPGVVLTLLGIATFAISFLAPGGVTLDSLNWQPVFAGAIFLAVGVNAVLLGIVAKIHGCARGLLREDRWLSIYRRYFRLEVMLLVAGALIVVGVLLDLRLFGVWTSGGHLASGLQLAALAQGLLIVGAELATWAFLVVAIDSE